MAKTPKVNDPVAGAQRGLLRPGLPQSPKVPQGLGEYGALRSPDKIYLFGTDEEVMNRNATGYNVSGTPPENRAPAFKQIRPGPTAKDLNKPTAVSYKGDQKYGSHRKYA